MHGPRSNDSIAITPGANTPAQTLSTPAPVSARRRPVDGALVEALTSLETVTRLPFLLLDATTGEVRHPSSADLLPCVPPSLLEQLEEIRHSGVVEVVPNLLHYAVRLESSSPNAYFAVGYALVRPGVRPPILGELAQRSGWDEATHDAFLSHLPVACRSVLDGMLRMAREVLDRDGDRRRFEEEIELLGLEMQRTYEEIALLHTVTRHLQISVSPSEIADLCLDRVHALTRAEGTAIWIEPRVGERQFQVRGQMPLDEIGIAHLVARFEDQDWRQPLVRNHVGRTVLGALLPTVNSFVIVPISEGGNRSGWIVCCNAPADSEFGTEEASLLRSVATILGTHLRNITLYNEHEQLLVGFVQSLVSTLDAKDPYTRGHSERVALIARNIASELGLPDEELETIHLAGILHDIGKIGVDDGILRKPGRLTREEFEEIQKHPMIGFNIVSGVSNLHHVLPGVRNHHENWDGSGYPDQLRGEEIPLMARILAVADAYDAMGSDRPYRTGMPIERVEDILRSGAGKQWDPRIIDAYFRVRKDVRALCRRYADAADERLVAALEPEPSHELALADDGENVFAPA